MKSEAALSCSYKLAALILQSHFLHAKFYAIRPISLKVICVDPVYVCICTHTYILRSIYVAQEECYV
jgi:hypothetical protein